MSVTPSDSSRYAPASGRGLLHESDPLRSPTSMPAPARTKRAWVLWLLTLFVPGGAQVVAGNKRLGRIALTVTVTCWCVVVVALLLLLFKEDWLVSLVAQPNVQLVAAIVLAALAVGWLLLFLNTLAIIRPGLLAPGAKGLIGIAVAAAVVLTTGGLGYGSYMLFKGRDTLGSIFASRPPIDPVDGRYNFLVMGGDAGQDRTGLRPDSSAVWSIDAKTGKILVISIPRNMQNVPFPANSPMHKVYPQGYNCGDECIFNSIYPRVEEKYKDLYPDSQDPGAQATMEAASAITGLQVQAYVVVDMGGFKDLINALGGVDVTSGGWVPYNSKPDPRTGLRTRWFAPGHHHFTGNQALWYARSRDFTTDYHRIRRQQCLQQAMINQFTPSNVLTNFTNIMDTGKQIVRTDLPQGQLGSFLNLANKARKTPFDRLTLGAPDFGTAGDKFSTYPDFDAVRKRIQQIIDAQNAGGSKKSLQSSEAAASSSKAASGSSGTSSQGSGASQSSSGSQGSTKSGSSKSSGDSLKRDKDVPTTQPDGSPITQEYLQQLELNGQTGLIEQIAQNNDECKPN